MVSVEEYIVGFKAICLTASSAQLLMGTPHLSFPWQLACPRVASWGQRYFSYINDLEDNLPTGIDLAIYADDTTIYGTMSCQDDAIGTTSNLQSAVDAIQEWGNAWRVTVQKENVTI